MTQRSVDERAVRGLVRRVLGAACVRQRAKDDVVIFGLVLPKQYYTKTSITLSTIRKWGNTMQPPVGSRSIESERPTVYVNLASGADVESVVDHKDAVFISKLSKRDL